MKFIKNIALWIYIRIHGFLFNLSIALHATEVDILKADPNNIGEKDKKNTRKLHRNPLLEKFYAGKTDEKYVQDYYEVLKKADKFMKNATPFKMELAADKFSMNYAKDAYGRRYENYGFFTDKHKYAGKTLGEVILIEMEERRTKDDDFGLMAIFNNEPVEVGMAKIMDVVEESDGKIFAKDTLQKSKKFDFPIKIYRINENNVNRIEQLSECMHVKNIGLEFRQLEFFIPLKFMTDKFSDDSDVIKEIIDIQEVFVKDDYGQLIGFKVNNLIKRIKHNNMYEVFKFEATEMQTIN